MRFIRKTHYAQDFHLIKHSGQILWYGLLVAFVLSAPMWLDRFYLGEMTWVYIYAIAGVGLMLLVGYTGLVSLGHAAFIAIGAYTHAILLDFGLPVGVSLLAAVGVSAGAGIIVAIPAMRTTGIYLAVATLAFAVIVEQIVSHWGTVTGGFRGMVVPEAQVFGVDITSTTNFYYLCLFLLLVVGWLGLNLLRSPTGRAMVAIRDSEISAESMGINLASVKSTAFAISAGFTGLAGALMAHKLGYLAPDAFTLQLSIQLLLLVIVGGVGSFHGVIFGAIFIGLLPQAIALMKDVLPTVVGRLPGLEPGIFGLILILVLIYEPLGIYGRWLKVRDYFDLFPLYRRATHKRQKQFLRTERLR